jgi:hypothetical protein
MPLPSAAPPLTDPSSAPRRLFRAVCCMLSIPHSPRWHGVCCISPTMRWLCPCRLLHIVTCTLSATRCAQLRTSARTPPRMRARTHTRAHALTRVQEHADRYGRERRRRRRRRQPRRRVRCGPCGDQPFLRMSPPCMLTELIRACLRLRVVVRIVVRCTSSAARCPDALMRFVALVVSAARYALTPAAARLALHGSRCRPARCLLHVVGRTSSVRARRMCSVALGCADGPIRAMVALLRPAPCGVRFGCMLRVKWPRCRSSAARRRLAPSARTHARACRTRGLYGAGGVGREEDGRGPFRAAHHLAHAWHCHRLHLHGRIRWLPACCRVNVVGCVLSVVRCLLHGDRCTLSAPCCAVLAVRCTLSAPCRLHHWCLLHVGRINGVCSILSVACRMWSSARCLLHVVRCTLSAACCPLHDVSCAQLVAHFLSHVVRCTLSAARCPLHGFVARCLLDNSCWMLSLAGCLLPVARLLA